MNEPPQLGRIQSVSRAVTLLKLVAGSDAALSGTELAKTAGLAVPTAHHLLGTLVAHGLLARDGYSNYVLGPSCAVIADAYDRGNRTPDHLIEPLRRLVTETGETGYLAAWRHDEIALLSVIDGALAVRVAVPTGPYRDAHARASGKLLLAFARPEQRDSYLAAHPLRAVTPRTTTTSRRLANQFATIRATGYAVEHEEFVAGVCCLAAPVMQDGAVIASYGLSVPAERFRNRQATLTAALVAAAHSAGNAIPLRAAQ